MAIGMGFQNTAGPEKHQAVALLVQSDKSIFLNCRMDAFQDTLYAHSKAQFYRNCVISGTVDFIFGDAAAVFQNCILVLRRPMDNQQNIATAQGRADAREATGFVLQKWEFQAETAVQDAGGRCESATRDAPNLVQAGARRAPAWAPPRVTPQTLRGLHRRAPGTTPVRRVRQRPCSVRLRRERRRRG